MVTPQVTWKSETEQMVDAMYIERQSRRRECEQKTCINKQRTQVMKGSRWIYVYCKLCVCTREPRNDMMPQPQVQTSLGPPLGTAPRLILGHRHRIAIAGSQPVRVVGAPPRRWFRSGTRLSVGVSSPRHVQTLAARPLAALPRDEDHRRGGRTPYDPFMGATWLVV